MKKLCLLSLSLFVLLCFVHGTLQAGGSVTLATLDWEPYIGEKLPDQGYVASLVRESYKATGYTTKIAFMPWARVVAMAKEGKYDGYLPEYYAELLKAEFFLSEPFPGGPLGFFKKKADNISFKTLNDLKDYKIGVVRDYVNTEAFDKADFLQKEVANNDLTNLRKLVGSRLDLVVADKFVGTYLLKQDMPDKVGEIEFVTPALEEKSLYLCISKKVPDAEAKIKAFNDGLKIITDNGTLVNIMKANGF
ncbi:MAG: transporter substrate-binding domain-containing protein [Proteobacteria bacterium]|nr:transporter substrate-binding domain-containing protein [Pseudomonadota bacterium]